VDAGSAAAWLGAGAMMDLSDGLASDARRLCAASGVGCRVELDLLPVSEDTRGFLVPLRRDPEVLAATGGEDYELLISAPEPVLDALAESVEVPIARIGEVTQGSGPIFLRGDEAVEGLSGWDHFPAT
jgi:thiamine-monophosphate kinase